MRILPIAASSKRAWYRTARRKPSATSRTCANTTSAKAIDSWGRHSCLPCDGRQGRLPHDLFQQQRNDMRAEVRRLITAVVAPVVAERALVGLPGVLHELAR